MKYCTLAKTSQMTIDEIKLVARVEHKYTKLTCVRILHNIVIVGARTFVG